MNRYARCSRAEDTPSTWLHPSARCSRRLLVAARPGIRWRIPEAYLTAFVNLVIEAGLSRAGRLGPCGRLGVGLAAIQWRSFSGPRGRNDAHQSKLGAIERAGADLSIHLPARRSFRRSSHAGVPVQWTSCSTPLGGDLRRRLAVLSAAERSLPRYAVRSRGVSTFRPDETPRPDRGLDARSRSEPRKPPSWPGSVTRSCPVRSDAERDGRFGVSAGTGGGCVSADARGPEHRQDAARLETGVGCDSVRLFVPLAAHLASSQTPVSCPIRSGCTCGPAS